MIRVRQFLVEDPTLKNLSADYSLEKKLSQETEKPKAILRGGPKNFKDKTKSDPTTTIITSKTDNKSGNFTDEKEQKRKSTKHNRSNSDSEESEKKFTSTSTFSTTSTATTLTTTTFSTAPSATTPTPRKSKRVLTKAATVSAQKNEYPT